jgi:hypothetical protein
METAAGLLLLWRRTITAGLLLAAGAFTNVVMINLSYDVPVKLYSIHLVAACLILLALDARRLATFLMLNRSAEGTTAWDPNWGRPWQRRFALGAKAFFIWEFLLLPLRQNFVTWRVLHTAAPPGPFPAGVYDVRSFARGPDTIPASRSDSMRWRDVIIDDAGAGSVGTRDTVFWQRYRRGYFHYAPDTVSHLVSVWKISTIPGDSSFLFTMRYEVPDPATIRWHTAIRGDSVHVELVRVVRHFQLGERQFHWLSEYNR